jgi:hypothetical protein
MGMVWITDGNGRHRGRWFPDGEEPETEEEAFKETPMSHKGANLVRRNIHFESHQLPRNHPSAKDVCPKTGKPRFTSRYKAEEFVRRARDIGENVAYDEL